MLRNIWVVSRAANQITAFAIVYTSVIPLRSIIEELIASKWRLLSYEVMTRILIIIT
jgi:hypothetical protein